MDPGPAPSLPSDPVSLAWKCCVCGFGSYHRVAVLRKNGSRYETAFFACNDCSVMFINDTKFNGRHDPTPAIDPAAVVTPMRKLKQLVVSERP